MIISTWSQTFSTGRTPSRFVYYAKVSVWKCLWLFWHVLLWPLVQTLDIQQLNLIMEILGTPPQEYLNRITSESVSSPSPGYTCVPCRGNEQKAWMVLLHCNPSFLCLFFFFSFFIYLTLHFCFYLLIYFSWLVGSVCGRNALAPLARKIGGISFRLDQSHVYLHPSPPRNHVN